MQRDVMRRTIQLAKVFLSLCLYAVFAPFGYGAFLVCALLPSRDVVRRARRFQAIIRGGFRTMHAWLRWWGLIDFAPGRIAGTLPTGPCLIVANHPTWTDVTMTMAAIPEVVTLIRETTYSKWWLRPLLRAAGQVSSPITAEGVAAMTEQVGRRFAQGFRVLAFPEGQRSPPEGGLRPFSRAPFEAAFRAGVPVVPVAIRCRPEYLTKAHGIFHPPPEPARVAVHILPPIPAGSVRTSRELRDVARARIEAGVSSLESEAA